MEKIKNEKFRIPADIDDSYENYCNEIISFINLSSKNIAHIINVVNMIKNIENVFFVEIKKKFSINNIIVPNNPLFVKP